MIDREIPLAQATRYNKVLGSKFSTGLNFDQFHCHEEPRLVIGFVVAPQRSKTRYTAVLCETDRLDLMC